MRFILLKIFHGLALCAAYGLIVGDQLERRAFAGVCTGANFMPERAFMLEVGDDYALTLVDGRVIKLASLYFPAAITTPLGIRTKQALQDMLEGVPLRLALVSAQKDRWGRISALVTFANGVNDAGQDAPNVQIKLLEAGLAFFDDADDEIPCADSSLKAEAHARTLKANLWATADFGALASDNPASVWQAHLGRFVVVTGIIASIGHARGNVFVNFRHDELTNRAYPRFSARAPPDYFSRTQRSEPASLDCLINHRIGVRGLLIAAGLNEAPEPEIVVHHPGDIFSDAAGQRAEDICAGVIH